MSCDLPPRLCITRYAPFQMPLQGVTVHTAGVANSLAAQHGAALVLDGVDVVAVMWRCCWLFSRCQMALVGGARQRISCPPVNTCDHIQCGHCISGWMPVFVASVMLSWCLMMQWNSTLVQQIWQCYRSGTPANPSSLVQACSSA